MKKMMGTLVVAMVLLLSLGQAQALPVIDFAGQSNGGTITISNGDVIGVNIPITSLLVSGAPMNDGQYPLDPGVFLNFDTSTGEISITDTAYNFGWFLDGDISSFNVQSIGNVIAFDAIGTDEKNPEFLAIFGIPANTPWAFFGFSLQATTNLATGKLVVNSTDVINTAVPEPATMLLLGSGLLGLGLVRRRQRLG